MKNDSGAGSDLYMAYYYDDTDRNGVYTIYRGTYMEGLVGWYARLKNFTDSSDSYFIPASDRFTAVHMVFENGQGELQVGGIRVSAENFANSFYLAPSATPQLITVSGVNGGSGKYTLSTSSLSGPPTYSAYFSDGTREINEGETKDVHLITGNVPAGFRLSYEFSGVDVSRLSGTPRSGYIAVDPSGTTTIPLGIKNNNATDGSTSISLKIGGLVVAQPFQVNDTSLSAVSYRIDGPSTINEGATSYYRLSTTGLASGTVIGYDIAGIDPSRLGMTGYALPSNFRPPEPVSTTRNYVTVNASEEVVISIPVLANSATDGLTQLFLNIEGGVASKAILVNDTSQGSTGPVITTSGDAAQVTQVPAHSNQSAAGNTEINTHQPEEQTFDSQSPGTDQSPLESTNQVLSDGDDHYIVSQEGFQIVEAGKGNDVIRVASTGNNINGGEGVDNVFIAGRLEQFTISYLFAGPITNYIISSASGENNFRSVERIHFDDISLALVADETAGQAYRLYKAAFDRAAEPAGLGYWMYQIDGGLSLESAAGSFVNSNEFQSLYGPAVSNEQFIYLLYENVLNRKPDTDGFNYWSDAMALGLTRAQVLMSFSESYENQSNVALEVIAGLEFIPFG